MTRTDQQRVEIEKLIGSKYQVLCKLGGGGMAQVLLARHRLHGGLFAVKILADHLAQDPNIVARFKQEATTAASLSGHPNIVSIFDIGEGNGLHYLIMQFVCGEDLSSYLSREGKLAPPAAAGVIAQTAEALLWAETRRVVHRDLKPANMLLDTSGRVKILDFGISKITDVADGLTRSGESLGTPFYMSPEQIRGEGCDIRSDLYSLGVVFFELLTVRKPFENDSTTAIQMAHLTTSPPSLFSRDPQLPPMCDRIVQKLLRKDRAERYQSAQELLDDLYAHGASSGPTTLRPKLDPGLQAEIDRAPQSAMDASSSLCTPTPTDLPGPSSAGAAQSDQATPVPRMVSPRPGVGPQHVPPPVPEPDKRNTSMVARLVAGSVAVLLLATAGIAFTLLHRAKTPAPALVEPKGLPSTLEDEHGRMVLVGAGDFLFGDNAPDSPHLQETVRLPDFYVDATEVSNAEYLRFAHTTGTAFTNDSYASAHLSEPATQISERDAAAYAAWAGKRLPTEQEWEKAARGTDGRPFPWGSTAWTEEVPEHLQPVNSFPERQSPYGALNMAGNAWEWTADPYIPSALAMKDMRRILKTQAVSESWHTIKGGSFSPGGSRGFRVYLRRGAPDDQPSAYIGFRCVKSASVVKQ